MANLNNYPFSNSFGRDNVTTGTKPVPPPPMRTKIPVDVSKFTGFTGFKKFSPPTALPVVSPVVAHPTKSSTSAQTCSLLSAPTNAIEVQTHVIATTSIGVQTDDTAVEKFTVVKFHDPQYLRTKSCCVIFISCFKTRLCETRNVDEAFKVKNYDAARRVLKRVEAVIENPTTALVTDEEFEPVLHAFINLSDADLQRKLGTNVMLFIYIKTVQLLINQIVDTPQLLMSYVCNLIDSKSLADGKRLLYAIRLACSLKESVVEAFGKLNPSDFWPECFAIALSYFIRENGFPVNALKLAVNVNTGIKIADKLIISITCDLVAASYGHDFIPSSLYECEEYGDARYLSKKMMRIGEV
jgi:hypothetical protein